MFTKGEWIADNGESEIWGVFSDMDSDGIAYLCEPNGTPLRSFDEAKANAQLIASAPKLYEALKEVKETLAFTSKWGDYPDKEKIDKALAKAEGRE